MGKRQFSTLVAMSYSSPLTPPIGVDVHVRRSDWGMKPLHQRISLVTEALRLAWIARRYERLVLVTSGLDLFIVCLLVRRTEIIAADWLIPTSRRLDRVGLLKRVDRFVIIRRADATTLKRRFGVDSAKCGFVPFPAPSDISCSKIEDDGFYYSAGWAHRDWSTLLEALRNQSFDTVISCGQHMEVPDSVTLLEQLSPEEGRQYLRRARCVVLPLVDTELPSGPLVLLDAMAHGKPIIVSAVGGAVDYVTHGESALVVRPGDCSDLTDALERVDSDPGLREKLSAGALAQAMEYTAERFWQGVLDPGA
jgi:glycosyltransferase involved in cell wall biosynthesis